MQELVVAQAAAAPAAQWASGSAAAKAAKAKAGEGPEAWPRARERGGQEEIADFGQLLAALCLGGQAPAGAAVEAAAPAAEVPVTGEPGTTAAALAAQAPLLTMVNRATSSGSAQGEEGASPPVGGKEAAALMPLGEGQGAAGEAVAVRGRPNLPATALAVAAGTSEEGLSIGALVKAASEQGALATAGQGVAGVVPAGQGGPISAVTVPAAAVAGAPGQGLPEGAVVQAGAKQGAPVTTGQGEPGMAGSSASLAAGGNADRVSLVGRLSENPGPAPAGKEYRPLARLEDAAVAAARQAAAMEPGSENPGFAGAALRELPAANLAREIVSQGLAVWQRGYGYVRLKLEPEFLGHLDLRVTSHLGHLSAHLVVENEAVRSLVQACLPHLEQNLAQHGLSLARFQVEVGGSGAGHTAGGFGRPAAGGGYNYPSSGGRTNWWAEQERPANGFFLVNYLA